MENYKILFGMPTRDGNCCVPFLGSMLQTQRRLDALGIANGVYTRHDGCYVARARNEVANLFMSQNWTHLFFIDADMGWDYTTIERFLKHDKDIVVGAYTAKNDDKQKRYLIKPVWENDELVIKDGLVKVHMGATGFMCIKRKVFEQMKPKTAAYLSEEGTQRKNYFHCEIREFGGKRIWMGEDTAFCDTWIKMGGEIWCDPDVNLLHFGNKVWMCNYKNDIKDDLTKEKKSD